MQEGEKGVSTEKEGVGENLADVVDEESMPEVGAKGVAREAQGVSSYWAEYRMAQCRDAECAGWMARIEKKGRPGSGSTGDECGWGVAVRGSDGGDQDSGAYVET